MRDADACARAEPASSSGDRSIALPGSFPRAANSVRVQVRPRTAVFKASLILLLVLLAGCGGTRRVLGPPTLSVQEIETVDGHYVLRIRLDSPSSMAMTLQRFDWKLTLDGAPAANGVQALTQVLPPVAGDIVRVDLGAVSALPILASLDTNRSITYVFEGELQCSQPNVHFPLRYEGRLRATPGKPGSFR